ncbi:MAG: hypothetical protein KKC79_19500 [Gammaproteobacteria bacterium]|nr:hypothetical protein [Gammaproteobacteria bacterium]MBU1441779.1 hypothetical protein [Gammaproteobacteria bacterium]MBU2410822.1 hypothetical protein [Gammaproteobacteria bacterium]
MAWTRTAISALVCAAVYLRFALHGERMVLGLGGAVLLLGGIGMQVIAVRRRAQLAASYAPTAPASRHLIAAVCLVVVGAVAGAVTALVSQHFAA